MTNDTIALNRSTQHGSRPGLRSLRRAVAVTRHNANRNICSRSVAYAGRRSHTRTYADAHPNYGADSQTCDRGPTGSDEHPNPHTSSQPDRHANAYPTCHTHTFPNSNCRTRCNYGSNKYAYSYTHARARARHSRTAAGFRGKGQRGNAAVSRVNFVSSGDQRATFHREH